jgi:excinuclease ABC subunit B
LDNRPLKFDEFETLTGQLIYVSATPADYELQHAGGVVVEQLIRPTGLLDPLIEVRSSKTQVDNLLEEIEIVIASGGRVLATTLTKRMAEELSKYLTKLNIKCRYIHSDIETLERVEIMRGLRLGQFDVLVGVNLLREGLDLPEVSLVAILDADKEGFLRSERSLTQTAGRAARNMNSKVIMYAEKITGSMRRTIDETNRRRAKQLAYNEKYNIIPQSISRSTQAIMGQTSVLSNRQGAESKYNENKESTLAADPVYSYMSAENLQKAIAKSRKAMDDAVKELDFIAAARCRDEIEAIQQALSKLKQR